MDSITNLKQKGEWGLRKRWRLDGRHLAALFMIAFCGRAVAAESEVIRGPQDPYYGTVYCAPRAYFQQQHPAGPEKKDSKKVTKPSRPRVFVTEATLKAMNPDFDAGARGKQESTQDRRPLLGAIAEAVLLSIVDAEIAADKYYPKAPDYVVEYVTRVYLAKGLEKARGQRADAIPIADFAATFEEVKPQLKELAASGPAAFSIDWRVLVGGAFHDTSIMLLNHPLETYEPQLALDSLFDGTYEAFDKALREDLERFYRGYIRRKVFETLFFNSSPALGNYSYVTRKQITDFFSQNKERFATFKFSGEWQTVKLHWKPGIERAVQEEAMQKIMGALAEVQVQMQKAVAESIRSKKTDVDSPLAPQRRSAIAEFVSKLQDEATGLVPNILSKVETFADSGNFTEKVEALAVKDVYSRLSQNLVVRGEVNPVTQRKQILPYMIRHEGASETATLSWMLFLADRRTEMTSCPTFPTPEMQEKIIAAIQSADFARAMGKFMADTIRQRLGYQDEMGNASPSVLEQGILAVDWQKELFSSPLAVVTLKEKVVNSEKPLLWILKQE